ncbi:MAG: hypothetical protein AVDCRST_MAG76-2066 [uncultured Acidimicrobiales bacterium]|uniref:DUF2079 domain-containing protein n=1 Tax=uncultured Acidimicrobiales bacterium TaxID=310071 RepID=A0A6J4ICV4_9ACTN|nr:MAG: hypothetical protein AVDCRST_MAG76-2066 [uncultured Acidimicrobiales bacterium]
MKMVSWFRQPRASSAGARRSSWPGLDIDAEGCRRRLEEGPLQRAEPERESRDPDPEGVEGPSDEALSLGDRLRRRLLAPRGATNRPEPEAPPADWAETEAAPKAPDPPEEAEGAGPEAPAARVVTVKLPLQHWDWAPDADTRPVLADRRARLVVAGAAGLYIWLFSYWTMRHYDGFGTTAFDFAIYDQGVWLLSRFKEPFVTVMGRHLFGDHTSFILLPLVPIYWILPTGKVLLVAQAAALGSAAVPTFLLARDKLRNELLAAVLAVVYLLHPAVGHINLEQFHPDVFEVPLALFAFWFMVRHRWFGFFACVVALLLVKEDVALLTFPLGVYVAVRHDRRVGLATCWVSMGAMALALWWILPMYNEIGSLNAWRVPFGGVRGFMRTAVGHPGRLINYIFDDSRRPWYLWQLLSPLAFLPLLAPRVLLIGLPLLAVNVFSTFYYQYDIRYHYGTLVLPVLVTSTIFAIAKARSVAGRQIAVGLVAATTLLTAYLWGPTPLGRKEAVIASPSGPSVPHLKRAFALIPDDAVVSAFYGYVPHLAHREEIYMFPNPFSTSYYGTSKQGGLRLPAADRVEYVVVPTALDAEPKAVFNRIRKDYDVVYEAGNVTMVKKKPPPAG